MFGALYLLFGKTVIDCCKNPYCGSLDVVVIKVNCGYRNRIHEIFCGWILVL